MKADDLRKSILQEAVQGKLVPQDKNDEPASELLKRIQAEKAILIKEGKLKKEKPLPLITEDEIPFDLPEGWVWCRLSSAIIDVSTGPFGSMLHKSDYVDNGIPLINPMNIVNESIIPSIRMMVDEKTRDRLSSYILSEGNVVIARRGELGRCAIVTAKEAGWLCGTGCFFIRLSRDIYARYFTLVFRSNQTLDQLNEGSVGTTMNNLNHEILKSVLISVPPFAEQQRIVAKVDELMVLCNELEVAEKELNTLESHFTEYLPKSILQAAVQGKLVPQDKNDEPSSELLKRIQTEKSKLIKEGKLKKEKSLPPITEDEIPYDLPDGWAWCRLSDIARAVCGKENEIKSTDVLSDGLFPVISQGKAYIDGYSNDKERLYKINGPLVMFGDHTKNVKFIDFDFIIGADGTKFLEPICIDSKYLYYLILHAANSMIDRGYARHFILLKKCIFPLPPLAEQQRIVTKVDDLMALCDEMRQVGVQPIDHSNVVALPVEADAQEEPLLMAAQGKVAEQPSKKHALALDELIGMMDDE